MLSLSKHCLSIFLFWEKKREAVSAQLKPEAKIRNLKL